MSVSTAGDTEIWQHSTMHRTKGLSHYQVIDYWSIGLMDQ